MKTRLLFSLICIPLMVGCTANASGGGSTASLKRFEFTSDDLIPGVEIDETDHIKFSVPNGAVVVGGRICDTYWDSEVRCVEITNIDSSDFVRCNSPRVSVEPDTGVSHLVWYSSDECYMSSLTVFVAH